MMAIFLVGMIHVHRAAAQIPCNFPVEIFNVNSPILPDKNNEFVIAVPTIPHAIQWTLRGPTHPTSGVPLGTTASLVFNQNIIRFADKICVEVQWAPGCPPVTDCFEFSTLVPECNFGCTSAPHRGSGAMVNNITLQALETALGTLDNQQVWVRGTLTVNIDRTITNSDFFMMPGSQIIQNAGQTTNIQGCYFLGCSGTWQGIKLNNASTWNMSNPGIRTNIVCNANRGILFGGNSRINVTDVWFQDCGFGIYCDDPTSDFTPSNGCLIAGCTFYEGGTGVYFSGRSGSVPYAFPDIQIGDNPVPARFNSFRFQTTSGIEVIPGISNRSNTVQIQYNGIANTQTGIRVTGNSNSTAPGAPQILRQTTITQCSALDISNMGIFVERSNRVSISWINFDRMENRGIWCMSNDGDVAVWNSTIVNTPAAEVAVHIGSNQITSGTSNVTVLNNNISFGRRGISLDTYSAGTATITNNTMTHIGDNILTGWPTSGIQGIRVLRWNGGTSGVDLYIGQNTITFNQLNPALLGTDPLRDITHGIFVSSLNGRVRIGQEDNNGLLAGNTISFEENSYRSVGIELTQPQSAFPSWIVKNRVNGAGHTGIRTVGVTNAEISCNDVVLSPTPRRVNNFPIANPLDPSNQFMFQDINVGVDVAGTVSSFNVYNNNVFGSSLIPTNQRFSVGYNYTLNPGASNGWTHIMECNDVTDVHTGVRFSSNNYGTALFNTSISQAKWGVWLDEDARIGPQGLNSPPFPIAISFDNTWAGTYLSNRTMSTRNTLSASWNPFYVRNVIPYNFPSFVYPNGIMDFSTPAIFTPISPTNPLGVCDIADQCRVPAQGSRIAAGGEGNEGEIKSSNLTAEMLEKMASENPDPENPAAVLSAFLSKQSLFAMLKADPKLRDGSPKLQAAYDSLLKSNLAVIAENDTNVKSGKLKGYAPTSLPEENLLTVNSIEAEIRKAGGQFTPQQIEDLREIARQCVHHGGLAVLTARSLLDLVDSVRVEYRDDCLNDVQNQQRLTEKADTEAGKYEIYPNPVKDRFTLTYATPEGGGTLSYELIDALGKSVKIDNLNAGEKSAEISVSGLPEGFYLLKLKSGNTFEKVLKVIIVK